MEWLRKFMIGRYGVDQLSRFFIIIAFIMSIVNIFMKNPMIYKILMIVSTVLLFLSIWRTFSKNIYKRAGENQKYLTMTKPISTWYIKNKNKIKNRKEYKYFKCSNCKKDLRVPRNKGKIVVTCPHCGFKMETKS